LAGFLVTIYVGLKREPPIVFFKNKNANVKKMGRGGKKNRETKTAKQHKTKRRKNDLRRIGMTKKEQTGGGGIAGHVCGTMAKKRKKRGTTTKGKRPENAAPKQPKGRTPLEKKALAALRTSEKERVGHREGGEHRAVTRWGKNPLIFGPENRLGTSKYQREADKEGKNPPGGEYCVPQIKKLRRVESPRQTGKRASMADVSAEQRL